MTTTTTIKVGLFVALAFLTGIGGYFLLSHYNPNVYLVRVAFSDTKGLVKNGAARMQGVSIGEVKEIGLDTSRRPMQPVVTLAIKNQFAIPRDSKFVIVSGILITNPQVDIIPGADREPLPKDSPTVLQGQEPQGALAALSPELQKAVTKLDTTFDDLTVKFNAAYVKIDKILDQTQRLLATVNDAARSGKDLIGDPRLRNSLLTTAENFREVSAEVRVTTKKLSRDLSEVVKSGKGNLDNLTQKLGNLLARIDATIDNANVIIKRVTDQVTDPHLQQSLQETVELSRATLARFTQIASDIHQLTGDPRLQNDLKQTVENLRGITDESKQVVEKVNDLLNRLVGENGKGIKAPSIRLPKVDLVSNISESLEPTRLRLDVEARLHLGRKNFLNFGFYDLGQDTRLTLQNGIRLTDALSARYGLYGSKIGAGVEYASPDGFGFRADLWDTSRPRLDIRGLFRVNSDASVWIGADSLLRRPVPLIGIQLKN